jgi:predicted protein tyrosine phosphatase
LPHFAAHIHPRYNQDMNPTSSDSPTPSGSVSTDEAYTHGLRALFICSRNRLRSPTAEALYRHVPGISAASAGTAADAEELVDAELIEWADVVFAMEGRHKKSLMRSFPHAMKSKRVVVLGVRDDYDFMDPELCRLLRSRIDGLLGIDSLALTQSQDPPQPKACAGAKPR